MPVVKLPAPKDMFVLLCKAQGLPIPEAEVRFHPVRKFRFDYAWVAQKLALEVDGGVWVRGAHGRGTGITRDQEKGNLAVSLGWRVLRVQPKQLVTMDTITLIRAAMRWRVEEAE